MTKEQFEEGLRVIKEHREGNQVWAIVRTEIRENESFHLINEKDETCFTSYDKGIFVEDPVDLTAYIPYDEIIALKY